MEKIASFTIDHTKLKRGIYLSRQDSVGDQLVTTFDLRLKEPNNEAALKGPASHTIEHIAATYLRNHPIWDKQTIYFGPMGCQTGFYLILAGDRRSEEIAPLIKELFEHVANFADEIPGESAVECGNYLFMDLAGAKAEAKRYLEEILIDIGPENLNYPE